MQISIFYIHQLDLSIQVYLGHIGGNLWQRVTSPKDRSECDLHFTQGQAKWSRGVGVSSAGQWAASGAVLAVIRAMIDVSSKPIPITTRP